MLSTLILATGLATGAIDWRFLADLPRALGGQFVGTAGEQLVVAGGSDWDRAPWDGGSKRWTDEIFLFDGSRWKAAGRLPEPVAYGATVTLAGRVLIAGGQTPNGFSRRVHLLSLENGRIEMQRLADLPAPRGMMTAAVAGGVVYLVGGQEDPANAVRSVWGISVQDLLSGKPNWREMPTWDGPPRFFAQAAGCGVDLYLAGGSDLVGGERVFLSDAYRFVPGGGWKKLPGMPRAAQAGVAACQDGRLYIFGGSDGTVSETLRERHPGFRRNVLEYDPALDGWRVAGELPASLVTTGIAHWRGEWVIAGGEDRPGHRSPKVVAARIGLRSPLTAAERQRVHPILIRNPQNELLELTVTSARPASLESVTCSLKGTDRLSDLEALELLAGNKAIASVHPAAQVRLNTAHPLSEGANVFVLSGRLKAAASLSRRIAASCSEVRTSLGNATVASKGPALRRRIGVALRRHNDDGVHTYRIPALATSAKGTLMVAYDMRRRMSRDLQEDIDIGVSRSTDGGQTWEPPRVIVDMGEFGGLPQELNGCSDPGIIVDRRTGEIMVFALWMWGKAGKHQWEGDGAEPGFEIGKAAQILVVRSRDDGRTWSKPENVTRALKKHEMWLFAPSPQQGIQLRDGTLVMPMQGRDERGAGFSTIMLSKDHGETWTVGAAAQSEANECQAAELSDGSIMLNMRNGRVGYRAVYVTKDLGRSWAAHETNANTLIEPTCNGSLYRFGRLLLFANPHSRTARTQHTLQISLDDGRTWPERLRLLLDEGRGRGYPSISRVDDKHIGIVYEGSRADLMFEKISRKELLAGAGREGTNK